MENILITGATGFLGSVLLYFILKETKHTSYVLVRMKKDISVSERLKILYEKELFKEFDEQEFYSRVIAVSGDTSQELLGIGTEDLEMLSSKLNVIIHCAATVSFNEELSIETKYNVYPVTQIHRLIKKCNYFRRWIHVSTAYVNKSSHDPIDQQLNVQFYLIYF